jgi:hypothetical protein
MDISALGVLKLSPIPQHVPSKVSSLSLAWNAVSNPAGAFGVLAIVSAEFCQVDVSAMG